MENQTVQSKNGNVVHYHGMTVRKLFITAAVIMVLSLPFLSPLLPVPIFISLLSILTIAMVAGLANPYQRWVGWLTTLTACGAFLTFEYHAVIAFLEYGSNNHLFFVNQILALIFLSALYLSTKTLRGMLLKK
ncbi:MAG: hypothetical protein AAB885_01555 [Patescibacteria group bacterium]